MRGGAGATAIALWLAAAAASPAMAASPAAADDGQAAAEAACAAHPQPLAAGTDLKALETSIDQRQRRADATALADACALWRHLLAEGPRESRLAWQSTLGGVLVWLQRGGQAAPLLEATWPALDPQAPDQARAAIRSAALLAFLAMQRGESERALQWSERAVATLDASGIDDDDALTLRLNHGGMLSAMRRFDAAQRVLEDTLARARTRGQPATTAAIIGSLAVLTQRRSRFDEALSWVEQEIALRREKLPTHTVALANALANRGTVLTALARHAEAEAAYREAIAMADRPVTAGEPDLMLHRSSVRENLAQLLLARGRPQEAKALAAESVAVVAASPLANTPRAGRALRALAEAEMALGELAPAVATFERALALLKTSRGAADADTAQRIRVSLARTLVELGDAEGAEARLREAEADARKLNPAEQALAATLRANLAERRQDPAAALLAWQAADTALALQFPPTHPQRRWVQAQRCALDAAACVEGIAAPPGRPDAPALEMHIKRALARRALADHRLAEADRLARDALVAARASGEPRLLWSGQALMAEALKANGRRNQAIFFGKLAIETLQQQRAALAPLGSTADARYLGDKAALYRRVAEWLLEMQRVPEALQVLALLKQQEQDEYLQRAGSGGSGLSFNEAESRARERFDYYPMSPDLDTDLDAVVAGLGDPRGPVRRARGLPRRVPAGTLHVVTLVGQTQLNLLLIGSRRATVESVPLPAASLAQRVAAAREAFAGSGAAAAGRSLFDDFGRLIDQTARRAGATRLVLWMDGPLRYLPLAALHDTRGPLAQRYAIEVVGPAGDVASRRGPASAPHIAAFGVTQALHGLPALPAVGEELCSIVNGPVLGLAGTPPPSCDAQATGRGAVPGVGRLDAAFDEGALRSHTAPDGLLHIGTHFVLRPGWVSRSWLLLGDGARLPLERLRTLPLGAPRLVTLSACETGVLDRADADGREVDGLAAALLDNGAAQVLASLWRVDDRATAAFMRDFYRALARHPGDAARALQTAQRAAIQAGAPVRHWAAFVLMGSAPLSAAPTPSSSPPQTRRGR